MNPNNNPQQYQGPPTSDPQQASNGAWDFLNTVEPQKPQSFFKRNKKFVIIIGAALSLLILLAAVAAVAGGGSKKSASLQGPSTSVATTTYDKEAFSFNYASTLNIALDEKNDDGTGWFVLFAEDKDAPDYRLSVKTSTETPIYVDGAEAVSELGDEGIEPTNVTTSDVVLAGQRAQKTVGEFTGGDGRDYYVIYSSVKSKQQYVTVSGTYLKEKQDITDSFDAMIGSIKLK